MLTIRFVFLEPCLLSPWVRMGRVLQLSYHTARSWASLLFEPPASMTFSVVSFHLFLGLPLFELLTIKLFAFNGVLSPSIFFMSLNYRNLCSLKNSFIFSTPFISQIVSLLLPSHSVLPQIVRSILISAVCNFLSSSFFKAQHPAPSPQPFSYKLKIRF